ncbi:MAG: uracil-DNA glycosylase [Chloroflexi bacterium]|nr:MAG: uracil-DNA glycosylase [Chloroflexota bacterium]
MPKPESKSLSAPQELLRLHDTIRSCKNCGLHATRTQAVPGVGPCPANVMIVGEAPGFNEDRQGEPFVGAAGKLLDTLLARIALSRLDVYITNVLKCRPPMNRDPMPNEAEACSPYLSISRLHGSLVMQGEIAYVPLYHPAAALHNGSLVADLEHDFDRVKKYLDRFLAPPPPPEPVPVPTQEAEQLNLL